MLRRLEVWGSFSDWRVDYVFECGKSVASDKFIVFLLAGVESMVAHSAFVCDLLRNELGVVASRNALVDDLLLAFLDHEVSVDKLSHL